MLLLASSRLSILWGGALQPTPSAPAIHNCVLQAPDHSIFGEEQGYLAGNGSSEWLWVIDPIDGTKSFITGACCA